MQAPDFEPCPCGSSHAFQDCCAPLLHGQRLAETAEQLMRSRYTAFVHRDAGYLLATWHPRTRPPSVDLDTSTAPNWIGLKILHVVAGGRSDSEGEVEFVARYKVNGRASRLHENSRFVRSQGRWYYVDGDTRQ